MYVCMYVLRILLHILLSLLEPSRLLTSAVVLLSFAFIPRAQRGRDGQSPNQNLEKFSSFEFLNICT